jgi:hypothetical protein
MFCSPTRQHRNGREKNHEIRQAQHSGSHHRPQNDLQRLAVGKLNVRASFQGESHWPRGKERQFQASTKIEAADSRSARAKANHVGRDDAVALARQADGVHLHSCTEAAL